MGSQYLFFKYIPFYRLTLTLPGPSVDMSDLLYAQAQEYKYWPHPQSALITACSIMHVCTCTWPSPCPHVHLSANYTCTLRHCDPRTWSLRALQTWRIKARTCTSPLPPLSALFSLFYTVRKEGRRRGGSGDRTCTCGFHVNVLRAGYRYT